VDDVVEATLRALHSKEDEAIFNIGSGEPTVIEDLVSLLMRIAGRPGAKSYLPADETAGTWRVARIDKARDALGWTPRTPLAEGLARTFAWMQGRP
jgi:UDP-glucose 4-epimerase